MSNTNTEVLAASKLHGSASPTQSAFSNPHVGWQIFVCIHLGHILALNSQKRDEYNADLTIY